MGRGRPRPAQTRRGSLHRRVSPAAQRTSGGLRPGESDDLTLRADYLEGRGPIARESTISYTGDEVPGRQRSYEWLHGLGEIVTTLAATGFQLTTLRESEVLPWPRWPSMRQTPERWWRLPDEAPRIPLLFALKATR